MDKDTCPLCIKKYDVTDKNFEPCSCGYKMCVWCWHKLLETSKRCPNCRKEYNIDKVSFKIPTKNDLKSEQQKNKKKKTRKMNPQKLANVRVIQRNLVYVIGLTKRVAKEPVLMENFSKYGKVKKIVINKSNLNHPQKLAKIKEPTVSAYVTFFKNADAKKAMCHIDASWSDGKMLRCSFGTTKYCSYFLRGIKCTNPNCMYLHEYGYDNDTYNREQIVLKHGLPMPLSKVKEYKFDSDSIINKHMWTYPGLDLTNDYEDEMYDEDEIGYTSNPNTAGIKSVNTPTTPKTTKNGYPKRVVATNIISTPKKYIVKTSNDKKKEVKGTTRKTNSSFSKNRIAYYAAGSDYYDPYDPKINTQSSLEFWNAERERQIKNNGGKDDTMYFTDSDGSKKTYYEPYYIVDFDDEDEEEIERIKKENLQQHSQLKYQQKIINKKGGREELILNQNVKVEIPEYPKFYEHSKLSDGSIDLTKIQEQQMQQSRTNVPRVIAPKKQNKLKNLASVLPKNARWGNTGDTKSSKKKKKRNKKKNKSKKNEKKNEQNKTTTLPIGTIGNLIQTTRDVQSEDQILIDLEKKLVSETSQESNSLLNGYGISNPIPPLSKPFLPHQQLNGKQEQGGMSLSSPFGGFGMIPFSQQSTRNQSRFFNLTSSPDQQKNQGNKQDSTSSTDNFFNSFSSGSVENNTNKGNSFIPNLGMGFSNNNFTSNKGWNRGEDNNQSTNPFNSLNQSNKTNQNNLGFNNLDRSKQTNLSGFGNYSEFYNNSFYNSNQNELNTNNVYQNKW